MRRRMFVSVVLAVLMVLLCFPVSAHADNQPPAEGTREVIESTTIAYLNNLESGKYVCHFGGDVSAQSGTLLALGDSIKWELVPRDVNVSSIRAIDQNDNALYLGASTASSVCLTTCNGNTIPDDCLWTTDWAAGSGIIFQSVAYETYLLVDDGDIGLSASLGTVGTIDYCQRVWRMAEATWFFGNGSSFYRHELPESFSFDTLVLSPGSSGQPHLASAYSQAMWVNDPCDFSFYLNSSYFTRNPLTGYITASVDITFAYTASVTVTHKPTGHSTTFSIVVNPRAVIMGVTTTGHDHVTTPLTLIPTLMNDFNYQNGAFLYEGTFMMHEAKNFLDSDSVNLFVSRSHGDIVYSNGSQSGTELVLNDSYSLSQSLKSTHLASSDLTNLKLALFIGCYTGSGGSTANNLPSVTVARGATTAVGFQYPLNCSLANDWVEDFFDLMSQGKTVYQACNTLASMTKYCNTTLSNYVICGSTTLKLV